MPFGLPVFFDAPSAVFALVALAVDAFFAFGNTLLLFSEYFFFVDDAYGCIVASS